MKKVYACQSHPQVVRGEINEEEAWNIFFDDFSDKNNDGVISYNEFQDYYAAVSCQVPTDQNFIYLMKKYWKL